MAKSSKSSSRKKSSSAKQKDAALDAEVVSDAETPKADAISSAVGQADTLSTESDEHEPMDYEVEDAVTEPSASDGEAQDAEPAPDQTAEPPLDDAETTAVDDEDHVPETPEPAEPEPAPLMSERPAANAGLFPSVLGGVIAGVLGFVVALLIFPEGWREQDNGLVTSLQTGLSEQQENLSALTERVEALGGQVEEGLGALGADILNETGRITALSDRLESLSAGDGMTALPDDVQILLNAQKERISELSEEVAGMAATAKAQMEAAANQQLTAEQAEARVKARAAMQDIRLALVNGDPFADALNEVEPAVDVPDGLQAVADEGVPTQANVQAAFPAAARAALSEAIREESGDDTRSRLTLFFKDQLGARSLTPQDGDDADAVLSRAEAAVKAEDFASALSEIENLPDSAKAKLADWQASASARMAALDGFNTVSNALNGN